MRGATPTVEEDDPNASISTHAPHAGRDRKEKVKMRKDSNFNSRAPCGARRRIPLHCDFHDGFQLTRPMRGATAPKVQLVDLLCISTHAPHAGRDFFEDWRL